MPDCAAQPACMRLVQVPSARYSMMPDAMEPTMPSASTICFWSSRSALPTRGRRAHRAEHRGRMEARLVHHLRRDEAEPAHQLDADRHALQRGLAVNAVPLADRQHRRHDHRAGMDRPALERVVEILAVRRGAVAEGRAGGAQRALVADGGAGPVLIPARECAADIVLVARGDAEADHVDQWSPRISHALRWAILRRRPPRCDRPSARPQQSQEAWRPSIPTLNTPPSSR